MSDILDPAGQPLTKDSINRTAENALNTFAEKVPRELGSHGIRYTVAPNLSTVVDGISHKATFAALTIHFENKETSTPFQLREYHDSDIDTQITQMAVANIAIRAMKGNKASDMDD
jgi:hypothetical protein